MTRTRILSASLAFLGLIATWSLPAGEATSPGIEARAKGDRAAPSGSATRGKMIADGAVTAESGHLPIIITAPHGGRDGIAGVAPREGKGVRQFNRKTDTNTARVAEELADALERKLGRRPYVVIARFQRKYIDANRPAKDAYESPDAKAVYDAYHAAIASARGDVAARWGRGALLDVHGQAMIPDAVIRGTQNGRTISALIERSGRAALTGERGLFGQLARHGLKVVPPVGSEDLEPAGYNGGFTVRTYGSADEHSVDAFQLELGRGLRETKVISDTAEKLAGAIADFARESLPMVELKEQDRTSDKE